VEREKFSGGNAAAPPWLFGWRNQPVNRGNGNRERRQVSGNGAGWKSARITFGHGGLAGVVTVDRAGMFKMPRFSPLWNAIADDSCAVQ
jgi:hypothetical protein